MKNICRLCSSDKLIKVTNLGKLPIAHKLLLNPHAKENTYPFALHYCPTCGLLQICKPIDPSVLYQDYNYCFSSWKREPHMEDEVKTIIKHTGGQSIFEIGCNDGSFLKALKNKGIPRLVGIEPNPFAGRLAKNNGLDVYTQMIDKKLCKEIIAKYGKFETVVTRQVLEHIPKIEDFFECIDILLAEDGFLFIDIPDFDTALSMGDCSMLWEEHVNYFTTRVIRNTIARFGFSPVSTAKYDFSGGTIAILARRADLKTIKPVSDILLREVELFPKKLNGYASGLKKVLINRRKGHYKVVLYGAGCRATTLVNGLGLGKYIDFVIDDQPQRQNKYMPGSRLRIYGSDKLKGLSEPIICLFAVNNENEKIVRSRIKGSLTGDSRAISLFSPKDIWKELNKI